MKRLFSILIVIMALAPNSFAQKLAEGSLKPILDNGKAQVILDFQDAIIHGMAVDNFAEYEKDWDVDKPIVIRKFMSGLVDKCKSIRWGTEIDAEITVVVKVLSINTKGDYSCDVIVTDKQNNRIALITDLNARGGTFGSKLNLIKDGAMHTGVKLGKFISRTINNYKI